MPESTWDKIKAIPNALSAAAGKKAEPQTAQPSSATKPELPPNTVVERKPLTTKDVNLPLKGSVYDKKVSYRRAGSGRPLTRRA